jgi:hypothetical protein
MFYKQHKTVHHLFYQIQRKIKTKIIFIKFSYQRLNIPSHLSIISHSPRIPVVRFIDNQNNKLRASNSQHLTCIQNVLSHNHYNRK